MVGFEPTSPKEQIYSLSQPSRVAAYPLIWRRRRESNPPKSARQADAIPDRYYGIELEAGCGIEPQIFCL